MTEFFDLSLDLLSNLSFDAFFKRVNASFERTLGYSKDELLSRSALEILHPDDVEASREALARLPEGDRHALVERAGRWHGSRWATSSSGSRRVPCAPTDRCGGSNSIPGHCPSAASCTRWDATRPTGGAPRPSCTKHDRCSRQVAMG